MKNERIINSFKNVSIATFLHISYILISFVVRTIFIKQLSTDYLSLNGLFTNVIALLSFAELGIGNAITYSLYEPLVKKNEKEIIGLMCFYKKAYRYIRIVILTLGIGITFILPFFISGVNITINYNFIYWLFLLNTYCTYLFSYKKTLLIADQKSYIVLIVEKVFFGIQSIIQCIVLIYFHNYILFLIIQVVSTLIGNIIVTLYVNNKYKYLKNNENIFLSKIKKDDIFTNIKSICLYKIGAVILNGTDNLLISRLIATFYVGLYSNYSMIVNAINGLLMQACNSLVGTIGQYNVEHSGKDGKRVFSELFLISFWIFGVSSVCMAVLFNSFIQLWIGEKYMLDCNIVIVIVLAFYITGINQIPSLYRTSYGIFKQARVLPIIAAFINIVLSIVLGKKMGLVGIFLATVIAKEITFNIFDPYIVFKKGFNLSPNKFFIEKIRYLLLLILNYCICLTIYKFLDFSGWIGFFFKCTIIFIISNLLFLVFLYKNENFNNIFKRLIGKVR